MPNFIVSINIATLKASATIDGTIPGTDSARVARMARPESAVQLRVRDLVKVLLVLPVIRGALLFLIRTFWSTL
jgi:hypothetical protein